MFSSKEITIILLFILVLSLVWFYGISTIVGYLRLNPVYTYILNMYDLVCFGLRHINHCWLFKAKSCLYISSNVGDRSRGRPEGSLFSSYFTEVLKRALLLSLDCSTLPLVIIIIIIMSCHLN